MLAGSENFHRPFQTQERMTSGLDVKLVSGECQKRACRRDESVSWRYPEELHRQVGNNVTGCACDGVLCAKKCDERARSFSGYVQTFLEKTETSLGSAKLFSYFGHVLLLGNSASIAGFTLSMTASKLN